MNKLDTFLTKEETKMVKGIAILLMMIHHLWGFPDRIAGGSLNYMITLFQTPLILSMGGFGKICVSFFFFLGGYGVYHSFYKKPFKPISKLKNLYIAYWKVFVIFVPIGYFFCSNQPAYCEDAIIYSRFADFSWSNCVANFLGLSSSINEEWWFLLSYVIAILTFPIIRSIAERFSFKVNFLLIVAGSVLITNVFPAISNIESIGILNNNTLYTLLFYQSVPYVTCFWMGVVSAKDGVLNRLSEDLKELNLLNPVFDLLVWAIAFYMRQFAGYSAQWDVLYVPFLVVTGTDLFRRANYLKYIFVKLGNQSTNIWLIHSFFCYYFYAVAKVVTATRWAVPSLATLVIFSYIASVALSHFWKSVESLFFTHKNRSKRQNVGLG